MRTVDGIVLPTFKDACCKLGLMDDDKEYIDGLKECSFYASENYVQKLFAMTLLSVSLSDPKFVWMSTRDILSEDILILERIGSTTDELSYNVEELRVLHDEWFGKLTDEQMSIYDEILHAVNKNEEGVFFVYGFGGTRKTFLWIILSAAIRSKGGIVLNVASSGIDSLLLLGGRTTHSRFGIPIKLDELMTCNIQHSSDQADVVSKASLIIWDEAPMMNKHCFESLDRNLRDIIKDGDDKMFGGDQCFPMGSSMLMFLGTNQERD